MAKNKNMSTNTSSSQISKYIDNERGVRAAVVNATEAVKKMQTIQQTYPIATMMVGRSMVAAALMAAQLKEDELVSLYFHGNGPIETVFAEATYEGDVRGYTPNPQIDLELKNGRLDLSTAIGKGTLNVVRSHAKSSTPYRGTVEIQTGEIGDDVAYYLSQSHQVKSVVSLGVKVNSYGLVQSAGGVIIELLPGADPLIENLIADRVNEASSLSVAIEQGASNRELLNMYLSGFAMSELEHPYVLTYACRCTIGRLMRSLELLPLQDLDDIIAKKETIKAKCEFCGKNYELPTETAQKLRDKKYRNTLN
jgi:molecular chaperone Hsp33